MAIYIVTYDPWAASGADFEIIHCQIQKLNSCQCSHSSWLVDAGPDAFDVFDELANSVKYRGKIMVAELSDHWASHDYNLVQWLASEERSWQPSQVQCH